MEIKTWLRVVDELLEGLEAGFDSAVSRAQISALDNVRKAIAWNRHLKPVAVPLILNMHIRELTASSRGKEASDAAIAILTRLLARGESE